MTDMLDGAIIRPEFAEAINAI